ncbi:MAG TPA: PqqD family protein [Anaerolineales bacterium]
MVNLDTVPTQNPTVVGRVVDGEAVLVLPEQGKVKVLNEVGARIWSLVDGKRSLREIAAILCAEYQVEPAEVEANLVEFVTKLAGRGIVSIGAQVAAP